ncbi:MAG: alpha/beta fold hydrolase [Candidatus Dadabacteria bacterium]|nr:MAG: alpha/beta fold hydrolase [Candidatus Dadabacteria bacterium]
MQSISEKPPPVTCHFHETGSFVTTLLAIAGTLALIYWYARHAYRVHPSEDEVHFITTDDGWRVALSRYKPRAKKRKHPIIMCHGLGANHLGFDLRPDHSVPVHLAKQGFDVWVLDLRGSGYSERASLLSGKPFRWTFDDYLINDAPAAIDYVCKMTRSKQVHWLGHSMGGLLLYSLLALGWSDRIRSAIVTGSSLNYAGTRSDFNLYLKLVWLTDLIPGIPAGLISRLIAPIIGRVPNPFEKFNWWPDNMDAADRRRLCAWALDDIPSGLLRQLATAFDPDGLKSADGTVNYFERLQDATTPVLVFAGDMDRQCPPEAAERTLDQLGNSEESRLVVLGRGYGQQTHYGHIDLLVGRQAPVDVWPQLDDWLIEHD